MLVSNDGEKIETARFYSTQARDKAPYYQHSKIGYNYRLSNISAGIGRGQLKVLDQRVAKKRYIFNFYRRELAGTDDLTFMPINDWNLPNDWLSVIQLTGKTRPAQLIAALEAENIESRRVWKPMHLQPVFAGCDYFGSGVGQQLFENGVCLPSDTKMTDADLERVCSVIKCLS
jgi:dTDP-4-amino-4,6-dideoxygalactose transaminase